MHKQPCLLILAVVVSCTAPSLFRKSRVKIDLSYDRSACANTPFPFWFPLTGFETETLADIDKARSGDPHALLSLGLVASGNVGNADTFQAYHDLVERFVETVRPSVEQEVEFWQKGFVLYKAMWKEFLRYDSTNDLSGYSFGQSRLSTIFENGTYNCISTAILYCILARHFDMKVQGVLTHMHAFVQLTAPNGKIIEVETTDRNGYDWIHNEEYFRKRSGLWFSLRGMPNQTFDDYQKRLVVEPLHLISHNMSNQHTDYSRMNALDVHRLIEYRSFIEDTSRNYQLDLLNIYGLELGELEKTGDYRQIARMYPVVTARTGLILERCAHHRDVRKTCKHLHRQFLSVTLGAIDTLIGTGSRSRIDSLSRLLLLATREITRLFPSDTLMAGVAARTAGRYLYVCYRDIERLEQRTDYDDALTRCDAYTPFSDTLRILFPNNTDVGELSLFINIKKPELLFALRRLDEFLVCSNLMLEFLGNSSTSSNKVLPNMYHALTEYAGYCNKNRAFTDCERLVDLAASHLKPTDPLINSFTWMLYPAFSHHFDAGNWEEAIRICRKQISIDTERKSFATLSNNLQACYMNWSNRYMNDGNWPQTRTILKRCLSDSLSANDKCIPKLQQIEQSHTF